MSKTAGMKQDQFQEGGQFYQPPLVDNGNVEEPKKKGRKRKFPSQTNAEKKMLYNTNQPYYNSKGKLIEPKVFKPTESCCIKHCYEKVGSEEQERVFNYFYALHAYESRTVFIQQNVQEIPKKRERKVDPTKEKSRREFSRIYYINHKIVCKMLFQGILQISCSRTDIAIKKYKALEIMDNRGKQTNRPNKLSPEKEKEIVDHINSFDIKPQTRRGKIVNYLDASLSISRMHAMFAMVWPVDHPDEPAPGITVYTKIFKGLNIKFKPKKKDPLDF